MDIKVRDLKQTETIENENKLMVLVDDDLNLVKNITKEEFLTNIISSAENNALVQETDGNLYVNTSEIVDNLNNLDEKLSSEIDTIETNIGDLADLTTEDKTSIVAAINEVAINNGENTFDSVPLGASKYSGEVLDSSLGWIKSAGQWNDGTVYTTFYNTAVAKIGESFAAGSIVGSTGTYTDYDLVINQTDQTFRLPLLDGSEDIPGDVYEDLGTPANAGLITASKNGRIIASLNLAANNYFAIFNGTSGSVADLLAIQISTLNQNYTVKCDAKKGHQYRIGYSAVASWHSFRLYYAVGNGDLYFKVANTIKNLELLDVGEVLSAVNDVVPNNAVLISNYGAPDTATAVKVSSAPANYASFTAPSDGYFSLIAISTASNTSMGLLGGANNALSAPFLSFIRIPAANNLGGVFVPAAKGETITVSASAVTFSYENYTNLGLWFIPTKGSR